MNALTVGFDLDMTLIDSRPGIRAVYDRISQETGVSIDSGLVTSRLGPPPEVEMANWFPTDRVDEVSARYRALYTELALPLIGPLPGALGALTAVRKEGRAIVITTKNVIHARSHVEVFGFDAADVFGGVWREGKADVLRREGAAIYVGDHIHDMDAAMAADVIGVGVTTGPCSSAELVEHGAAVVLESIADFPAWLNAR